jgi:hypothetical protein
MKKNLIIIGLTSILSVILFSQCAEKSKENANETTAMETPKPDFHGFESQVKWGEHIVTITGCNDCHTPKKMTDHGPDFDSSLLLSGHPAQLPPPDVNRKEMESKGLTATGDLTAWVGAWGVSYTGNLTSDETGIGNWKEEQFIYALREGKLKGLPGSRTLLPPMPWTTLKYMTDDELKAIFAYLKSTKPIHNIVPPPLPPVSAPH